MNKESCISHNPRRAGSRKQAIARDLSRALRRAEAEFDSVRANCRPRLWLISLIAALLPDFTLPALRCQLYRWGGCKLAARTALLGRIKLVGAGDIAARLSLAEGGMIAPGVTFGLDAPITIGRNVSISPNAVLYTGTHGLGFGSRRMLPDVTPKPITVEEGVWIGMQSLILPGVLLGRGCVVSAGAVVTQDVPPNTLVAGNPAVVQQQLPFSNR